MVSMRETSENPEFMKTIEEIRSAEEEYDRIIKKAQKESEKILRDAKEKMHEEREKTQESIVEFKNEKIRSGSKEIEGKVESMVKKGKDEGDKIGKKKLAKNDVSKLVKNFISNL